MGAELIHALATGFGMGLGATLAYVCWYTVRGLFGFGRDEED